MIYLSTRLESTVSKTVVAHNVGMRLAARTRCIRIHTEYSYESIPKYPRKVREFAEGRVSSGPWRRGEDRTRL